MKRLTLAVSGRLFSCVREIMSVELSGIDFNWRITNDGRVEFEFALVVALLRSREIFLMYVNSMSIIAVTNTHMQVTTVIFFMLISILILDSRWKRFFFSWVENSRHSLVYEKWRFKKSMNLYARESRVWSEFYSEIKPEVICFEWISFCSRSYASFKFLHFSRF